MPWFEEAWIRGGPDWEALWDKAEEQGGFFTNADTRACGVRRSLLSYHALRGAFERPHRGVYRVRWLPASRFDRVGAEWIFRKGDRAVVSHVSALFVLGLIDEDPGIVELTLPRSRRGKVPAKEETWRRGVRIHVPRAALKEEEILVREGTRVTIAIRSILDAAPWAPSPAGMEEVVRRAREREGTDLQALTIGAEDRRGRTERIVGRAVAAVAGRALVTARARRA